MSRRQPLNAATILKTVLNYAEDLAETVSLGLGRVPLGEKSLADKDIHERISAYRTIEGSLSLREATLLYRVAASLSSTSPVIPFSSDWASDKAPDEIDFLFIDGDHSFEAVKRDLDLHGPRVRIGVYIGFHDVGSIQFNGPKTVVEKFVVPSNEWSNHTHRR